jgi:hypothetical protein
MEDGLTIRRVDEIAWQEVRAQVDASGRRISVWNRFVDVTPTRTVLHTRYDPGVVLARHAHHSEEVIFVLDGDIRVGDVSCPAGTVIILEPGMSFGPLIAGDRGALIFEVFRGPAHRKSEDAEEFDRLLAELGVAALPDPTFDLPIDLS